MRLLFYRGESGLSPRVRGNPETARGRAFIGGSIPACAGEPSTIFPYQTPIWVYPRVCGGTLSHRTFRFFVPGLSPRVRGNLLPRRCHVNKKRSIPACAGEPVECIDIVEGFKVYPRVCGGTQGF